MADLGKAVASGVGSTLVLYGQQTLLENANETKHKRALELEQRRFENERTVRGMQFEHDLARDVSEREFRTKAADIAQQRAVGNLIAGHANQRDLLKEEYKMRGDLEKEKNNPKRMLYQMMLEEYKNLGDALSDTDPVDQDTLYQDILKRRMELGQQIRTALGEAPPDDGGKGKLYDALRAKALEQITVKGAPKTTVYDHLRKKNPELAERMIADLEAELGKSAGAEKAAKDTGPPTAAELYQRGASERTRESMKTKQAPAKTPEQKLDAAMVDVRKLLADIGREVTNREREPKHALAKKYDTQRLAGIQRNMTRLVDRFMTSTIEGRTLYDLAVANQSKLSAAERDALKAAVEFARQRSGVQLPDLPAPASSAQ